VDILLHHIGSMVIFAEKAAGDPAGNAASPFGDISQLLLPFVAIGFLFYFLLYRPQKAEQKRRLEMLQGVKKNDRILTTGGIYGVVTNVQRDDDEVTIKVDESTNTKLRVSMGSIGKIISNEPSGESDK
jgi:preprotein translocase subunit YajC